jgi:dihydroorotate dehydrogenase (NAD+) catalytic subunit
VALGRLRLANPILVASGTFGYGREMAGLVDLSRLGGIVPKTITPLPRQGNVPWRTVETAAGLLNSIGLDNDGVDAFLAKQLPWLLGSGAPVIVSIAGADAAEFVALARRLDAVPGIAALELNVSCPNVSHGVDLGSDPAACRGVVAGVREATALCVRCVPLLPGAALCRLIGFLVQLSLASLLPVACCLLLLLRAAWLLVLFL